VKLKLRAILTLLISLVAALPLNAAAPTPGNSCKKVGLTATASGKKYTCVKAGSKLVWNKGVVVPVIPKPIPVMDPPAAPKNLLRSDSRITSNTELSKLEICKTTDMTPDYTGMGTIYKNGFPRPTQSLSGKNSAKVLIIPISFNDLPFTTEKAQRGPILSSDLDLLNEVSPRVEESFNKLSGGRFKITLDILPKSQWWEFKSNHPFISTWGVSNFDSIFKLIDSEKSEFSFNDYDAYIFLGGNSSNGALNNGEAIFAQKINNSKSGYINAVLIAGGFSNPILWVHELGHALFAFEDLYLFKPNPEISGSRETNVPNSWDLMANSSRNVSFLEWNRLLMGWLKDSEVRCISDQIQSTHYLSDFENDTDPKLLTINLTEGVTLAAEARNFGNEKRLLLYTINTYTSHGEGPIISQNTLLKKADKKSIYGWDINVLDTNSEGVLFSVTKTDLNKFVPPKIKPSTPSDSPPTSKIKVTSTDISPIESSKAKATLKISGQQSYRIYVTAVDDFQKVFFESGFVNDSRSEISVNLTGLVCDRKLRAVIEIFTELDGKGERLVVQHNELGKTSC
jgi:hypothetical protein